MTDSATATVGYHSKRAWVPLGTANDNAFDTPIPDPVTFSIDAYTLSVGPIIAKENLGDGIDIVGVNTSMVKEKLPGIKS